MLIRDASEQKANDSTRDVAQGGKLQNIYCKQKFIKTYEITSRTKNMFFDRNDEIYKGKNHNSKNKDTTNMERIL